MLFMSGMSRNNKQRKFSVGDETQFCDPDVLKKILDGKVKYVIQLVLLIE